MDEGNGPHFLFRFLWQAICLLDFSKYFFLLQGHRSIEID